VTATAPEKYLGVISGARVAAYLDGQQAAAIQPEPPGDHATEAHYSQQMYSENPVLPSRRSRSCGSAAAIPSPKRKNHRSHYQRLRPRWTALEPISFSFQDDPPKLLQPDARLMLIAGELATT
jgi:hypothetical protein